MWRVGWVHLSLKALNSLVLSFSSLSLVVDEQLFVQVNSFPRRNQHWFYYHKTALQIAGNNKCIKHYTLLNVNSQWKMTHKFNNMQHVILIFSHHTLVIIYSVIKIKTNRAARLMSDDKPLNFPLKKQKLSVTRPRRCLARAG